MKVSDSQWRQYLIHHPPTGEDIKRKISDWQLTREISSGKWGHPHRIQHFSLETSTRTVELIFHFTEIAVIVATILDSFENSGLVK